MENRVFLAETIGNTIIKILEPYNGAFMVHYNGGALSIYDKVTSIGIDFWIYLDYDINNKVIVKIFRAFLPDNLQRKGLFTQIIKELKKLDFVDNIIIAQVSSMAMYKWVSKHKFHEIKTNNSVKDWTWKK